jgi:cation:H+ antiporter
MGPFVVMVESASDVESEFMLLTFFLLLLAAVFIYISCEFFVNAVEWLGQKLNLSATATGTVLAAFGTALPESAVTLTAVVFGGPHGKDLGIGAALGGPLVLATIAYGLVGLALWKVRRKKGSRDRSVHVNSRNLAKDQGYFLLIFIFKVALGFVVFSFKPFLGILFLTAYGLYVWREIVSGESAVEENLEPLILKSKDKDPSLLWILVQLLTALAVIAFASHFFVGQLTALAEIMGVPSHLVALFLSPVATELPEIMNTLIWVRNGKERLALANISGAMMIQATIPSALGLFFTPWLFDGLLAASALVTIIAISYLWILFRQDRINVKRLARVALLYGLFVAYTIYHFR